MVWRRLAAAAVCVVLKQALPTLNSSCCSTLSVLVCLFSATASSCSGRHAHYCLVVYPFAVKQRIRAIKNIGKITKAMKMVAASKMRNAQLAVENSRGMVEPFVRLFGDYPGINEVPQTSSRADVRTACRSRRDDRSGTAATCLLDK